jgi:hypothetical protein
VCRALSLGDSGALEEAVNAAEHAGLAPHAARMRIVLAQLTGDFEPLRLSRPVLEDLQDRQFLRRLEEVQAAVERAS